MTQMYPMLRAVATALLASVSVGCGSAPSRPESSEAARTVPAPPPDEGPLVVFLGDSLTAGFGLSEDEAFPAVVGRLLREEGAPIRVVNAGVSGDTTAGGLRRIGWVLRQEPAVVVVGLGANDALRGQSLQETEANLRRIVASARSAGAAVLLLGMRIPPNYGPDYAKGFRDLYPRIAEDLDVPLVPFLLDGVGGVPALNLPDGIHPNAEGHRKIAGNVAAALRPLVEGT